MERSSRLKEFTALFGPSSKEWTAADALELSQQAVTLTSACASVSGGLSTCIHGTKKLVYDPARPFSDAGKPACGYPVLHRLHVEEIPNVRGNPKIRFYADADFVALLNLTDMNRNVHKLKLIHSDPKDDEYELLSGQKTTITATAVALPLSEIRECLLRFRELLLSKEKLPSPVRAPVMLQNTHVMRHNNSPIRPVRIRPPPRPRHSNNKSNLWKYLWMPPIVYLCWLVVDVDVIHVTRPPHFETRSIPYWHPSAQYVDSAARDTAGVLANSEHLRVARGKFPSVEDYAWASSSTGEVYARLVKEYTTEISTLIGQADFPLNYRILFERIQNAIDAKPYSGNDTREPCEYVGTDLLRDAPGLYRKTIRHYHQLTAAMLRSDGAGVSYDPDPSQRLLKELLRLKTWMERRWTRLDRNACPNAFLVWLTRLRTEVKPCIYNYNKCVVDAMKSLDDPTDAKMLIRAF